MKRGILFLSLFLISGLLISGCDYAAPRDRMNIDDYNLPLNFRSHGGPSSNLGKAIKTMTCAMSTNMPILCSDYLCGSNAQFGQQCDYVDDNTIDLCDVLKAYGYSNPCETNSRDTATASIKNFDLEEGTFDIYIETTSRIVAYNLFLGGVHMVTYESGGPASNKDWQQEIAFSDLWDGKYIMGFSPNFPGGDYFTDSGGHIITVNFDTDEYVSGTCVCFDESNPKLRVVTSGGDLFDTEYICADIECGLPPTIEICGTMGNADGRDTIVTTTCCEGGMWNVGSCANDPNCGCDGSLDGLEPNPNYDETLSPSCNGGPIGDSGAASSIIVNYGAFGCGYDDTFISATECPMFPFLDLTGDGEYNSMDAGCIYSFSLGLLTDYPFCTPDTGVCANKLPGQECCYDIVAETSDARVLAALNKRQATPYS